MIVALLSEYAEEIVDGLKGQAEVAAVVAERSDDRGIGVGEHRSDCQCELGHRRITAASGA